MATSRAPGRLAVLLCGTAAVALLAQVPAFLAGPLAGSVATQPALRAASSRAPAAAAAAAEAQAEGRGGSGILAAGAVVAAAALAAAGAGRTACRAEGQLEAEKKDGEVMEEKPAFDVWKPDTYGNLTMADVKKYGTAGTVAYIVTELLFWAIAFPTECFVYLKTAGHWPDFSKPEESAEVLALVFAASNVARLMLPLRFGAAMALAPWVDENVLSKFKGKEPADAEA